MDIRKLQRLIVDALEDVKGADIRVFNSTSLTQLFDRVIIASGTSNRQTRALAASVRDKVKSAGGHVISVEGEETGEWVLVDLGDAIVHIMQPTIRAYYNLEELWGAKPVSMKSHDDRVPQAHGGGTHAVPARGAAGTIVKAARNPGTRKPAAKKAASRSAAKPPSKSGAKAAAKSGAKAAPKRAATTASKAAAKTARPKRRPATSG